MNVTASIAWLAAAPAALAAPLLAIPGDHLVVDAEGSTPFSSIQAAVDAASSGDVILVRPRSRPDLALPGFLVDGKALTIRAAGDVPVEIGAVRVTSLDQDQVVTLRGFHMRGSGALSLSALHVQQCQGSVHVQDSQMTLDEGPDGFPTAHVVGSLDVSFADCEITGGQGSPLGNFSPGGTGLTAVASRVTLARSGITGGRAGTTIAYSSITDTPDGGAAIVLLSRSVAWVEGSALEGGQGFSPSCHSGCGILEGGDGGPGADVQPGSIFMRLDSRLEGGPAGEAALGFTNIPGEEGPPLLGSELSFPGRLRNLDGPDSVRIAAGSGLGSTVPLRLTGVPGESVTAWASEDAGFRALGGAGVFGLRSLTANLTFDLGVVPATGILETSIALPPELSGKARTYGIQAGFQSGMNDLRLTRVHRITVHGGGVLAPTCGDVVYVASDAAPGGDGASWASAASSLMAVLDVLPYTTGQQPIEVWVKAGTYRPAPPGGSVTSSFRPGSGWRILGGFAGNETQGNQRDPLTHETILDGDLNGDDQPGFVNVSDNARRLLRGDGYELDAFTMDGFTFRGADGAGAITIRGNARFERCVFRDNRGNGDSPSVAFYAPTYWGDMDVLTFKNCAFLNNRSARASAVVAEQYRNGFELHGCLFAGNTKTDYSALTRGVAVTADGSTQGSTEIISCTFADNELLQDYTYQSCVEVGAPALIANSIFWSTRIPSGEVWSLSGGGGPGMTVQRNRFAFDYSQWSNNTTEEPLFVGPGDYRLSAASPLVDAGDNTFLPAGLAQDLDGDFRIKDDPGAPNVGVGGARIVDLGAYER